MSVINLGTEDTFDVGEIHDSNDLLSIDPKKKSSKSEESLEPQEFSEDRARIINKIRLYKENFPDTCSLVDIQSLTFMDDNQLEEYLSNVRLAVSNKNNTNMVESGINGAILGIETIGKAYYPKLAGMHAELMMKQAYHDCLKEIAIENCNVGYVRPEIRLAMLIGGSIATRLAVPNSDPISVDEAKKYDNL